MKLSKIILIIYCIVFFPVYAHGQQGCLVNSNGNVYTDQDNSGLVNAVLGLIFGGNPVYKGAPFEPIISTCTNNSQTVWNASSQNCTVCPLGYSTNILGVITGCASTTYIGKIANQTVLACPIDDYAWLLVISTTSIALIKMKQKGFSFFVCRPPSVVHRLSFLDYRTTPNAQRFSSVVHRLSFFDSRTTSNEKRLTNNP